MYRREPSLDHRCAASTLLSHRVFTPIVASSFFHTNMSESLLLVYRFKVSCYSAFDKETPYRSASKIICNKKQKTNKNKQHYT